MLCSCWLILVSIRKCVKRVCEESVWRECVTYSKLIPKIIQKFNPRIPLQNSAPDSCPRIKPQISTLNAALEFRIKIQHENWGPYFSTKIQHQNSAPEFSTRIKQKIITKLVLKLAQANVLPMVPSSLLLLLNPVWISRPASSKWPGEKLNKATLWKTCCRNKLYQFKI